MRPPTIKLKSNEKCGSRVLVNFEVKFIFLDTYLVFIKSSIYGEDLNSELVQYLNGPKQFACGMVRYSSHDLNGELKVCYSNHDLNSEIINRFSGHRVYD